jgi:hypothetical protein
MIIYKLITAPLNNLVQRLSDNAFIPFDPDNADYSEFKKAVTAGKELQDADGNVMTAEAAKEFVKGLA